MKYPPLILLLTGSLAGQTYPDADFLKPRIARQKEYNDSIARIHFGKNKVDSTATIPTWQSIQDSLTAKWIRYERWCKADSIAGTHYWKIHKPTPAEFFRRLKEW
jgi:hypothetical protein